MAKKVEPRRHAELTPPRDGDVPVTANVGPHGEAVALWSSPAGRDALCERTIGPGGASFASTHPPRGVPVRLVRHLPDGDVVVDIDELTLAHCHVQPLPGDRFLVVGARCAWDPAGPRPNAQVFDASGAQVGAAVFGDGIEDVATTPSGATWVSYFDEGVFGNNGWGDPGPAPVGASGLVRFDTELRRAWEYPYDTEYDSITDCYALNVIGERAFAYYYTEFPVVSVDRGQVTGWTTTVQGAHQLLTDGTRCALIGGYGKHHDRVVVGELTAGGGLEVRHRRRLRLPDGVDSSACDVVGRGDTLHVFSDSAHYVLDLDQLTSR